MRIIADAQQGAVLEPYARRPFYLDRQGIGGAAQPADFEVLPVERAILDLSPVVIGHEFTGRRLTEGAQYLEMGHREQRRAQRGRAGGGTKAR